MNKENLVFEKIKTMIIQGFNIKPEDIKFESILTNDFGIDSLENLELVNEIESEFLIAFDIEKDLKFKTVKDLVDYVLSEVDEAYFNKEN